MTASKEPAEGQAQGRIFQNKNRKVWMLAYCGPRPDGTWGEIRESAKTRSEEKARRSILLQSVYVASAGTVPGPRGLVNKRDQATASRVSSFRRSPFGESDAQVDLLDELRCVQAPELSLR